MDDSKQLYLEYRGLTEQLKKVQRYLEQTQESIGELNQLIEGLDTFAGLKQGDRIFAPMANGIFIDATLNSTELRMNVGGDIVVPRNVPDAQHLLRRQRSDLEQLRERATSDQRQLLGRMRQIEMKIEAE